VAAVEDKIEFRAQARWVRTAPRKAQLVVEEIRGRTVPEAQVILAFMTRAAAKDVAGVLNSAVANAESHPLSYYSGDELYVAAAEPRPRSARARRSSAGAHGRAGASGGSRSARATSRSVSSRSKAPQARGAGAQLPRPEAVRQRRSRGPKAQQARGAGAQLPRPQAVRQRRSRGPKARTA